MKCWRDGSLIPDTCKSCNKITICFGGCRLGAYPTTSKMNLPDTIADLNNVPIKYEKKMSVPFDKKDNFEVSRFAQFFTEDVAIRVSVGKKFLYLTHQTYEFLKEHSRFSFEDFKNYFDVDENTTNMVLKNLASCLVIDKI